MRKMFIMLTFSIMALLLGGCQKEEEEFITIDVFSSMANYQGIQGGWFGEVVKEKFNMELNIIAPNVAGGGDLLYQTRLSAGNLGDIVMISAEDGRLEETIDAGLLLDMTDYIDIMPNAMQYTEQIENIQKTIDNYTGIYGIPSDLSSFGATEPTEGLEPTFGPYLRWDLYEDLGYPEIETLEDLLPVLVDMQELEPLSDSGLPTYAFSFFKDWDGNLMVMAKQPACFYGYDEIGFVLNRADGSDTVSILDNDSPYIRSLKLYYEANQLGLVDPESTTQNWDTVYSKYEDGQILYSPWPWLGQSAYNTIENLEEGKGFMLAPINDMEIYSYGSTPTGNPYVVSIGSNAKYPERIAEFIDWLYSPEGITYSTSQNGSTGGPEGLIWELVDDRPELTEFGIDAVLNGDAMMPEEWGGGSWTEGISQLNFTTVLSKEINPETGYSYDFKYWDSYLEFTATPVHVSWQEQMGATSTFKYLEENNQVIVAAGTDYVVPSEPQNISNARSNCREIIVDYSWNMIFASDLAEFEKLLDEMQAAVDKLDYDIVLEYDMNLAANTNAARAKAEE